MEKLIHLGDKQLDLPSLIQSFIQSGNLSFLIGSGASQPAISVAGGIENEINALIKKGSEAEANRKALDFVESIIKAHDGLFGGAQSEASKNTLQAYRNFIGAVDRVLFERKNLLLPRQANLFTTNYDLFIEKAASAVPTLMLNDGFARSVGVGSEVVYAPERYSDRTYRSGGQYSQQSEVPTLNLIKLHGSLSWRTGTDAPKFSTEQLSALPAVDRSDEKRVADRLKELFLMLPNLQKFDRAVMDRVYYDLLRFFANSMDKENALLISIGFSFQDEHILDIARRGLRNPTSHLIIFAHKEGSAAAYLEKFAAQQNVTVIAPTGAESATLDTVTQLLEKSAPASS